MAPSALGKTIKAEITAAHPNCLRVTDEHFDSWFAHRAPPMNRAYEADCDHACFNATSVHKVTLSLTLTLTLTLSQTLTPTLTLTLALTLTPTLKAWCAVRVLRGLVQALRRAGARPPPPRTTPAPWPPRGRRRRPPPPPQ